MMTYGRTINKEIPLNFLAYALPEIELSHLLQFVETKSIISGLNREQGISNLSDRNNNQDSDANDFLLLSS
ncbi:MAG: hypothetical protein ACRYE9_04430 [Janthinobacterium lividum]